MNVGVIYVMIVGRLIRHTFLWKVSYSRNEQHWFLNSSVYNGNLFDRHKMKGITKPLRVTHSVVYFVEEEWY